MNVQKTQLIVCILSSLNGHSKIGSILFAGLGILMKQS
jgi:hypothetical protein